eukprot:2376261-Amphidinium_carterae.1
MVRSGVKAGRPKRIFKLGTYLPQLGVPKQQGHARDPSQRLSSTTTALRRCDEVGKGSPLLLSFMTSDMP